MEINIADAYFNRIKQNISGYTELLLASTSEKKIPKKAYESVISKYIEDVNFKTIKLTEDTEKFLGENCLNHYKLNNIVNYFLTYTEESKYKINTYKYANAIILTSKMLLIAIEVHTKTNIFINEKITYANLLNEIMDSNAKLYDKTLRRLVKKAEPKLKSMIKKNISDEKKFVSIFRNENFYLTYRIIDDNKVEVSTKYEIKALNKYMKSDIEKQIIKDNLDIKFFFVGLDLLQLTAIKALFSKRGFEYFFVELPIECLTDEKLIKKIDQMMKNEKVRNRIIFKVKYKDAMKNKSKLAIFKEKNINIAVYGFETLDESKDEAILNGLVKYILASKQFIDSNERLYVNNISLFVQENTVENLYITEEELLY